MDGNFTVELWGAGGGGAVGGIGGYGGASTWSGGGGGGAGGGGGGGGYYVECRLTGVKPGTEFEVHIGRGGQPSTPPTDGDGVPTAGGDSWITVAGRTIVLAEGGRGAAGPTAGGSDAVDLRRGLGGKGKAGGYHGPGAICTPTAGIDTDRLASRDGGSGTAGATARTAPTAATASSESGAARAGEATAESASRATAAEARAGAGTPA
ncbi:glycine-rich domain-containing protein [Streptomyces sp. NPDC013457]|uniref:glycine-rich domain-containing protein n=1 Tax=Streptomyces sp. NPDC013457 TaxID=3364866 RepID=UPI0036F90ADB